MPQKKKQKDPASDRFKVVGKLPARRETSVLWSGAPKKTADFLASVSDRREEIDAWFRADSSRQAGLAEDPAKTLDRMAGDLGLEVPDRQVAFDLGRDFELTFLNVQPVGSALLAATWSHLAASPAHTQDFKDDPVAVVRSVGAQEGSSQTEIRAVVKAIRAALGLADRPSVAPGRISDLLGAELVRASGGFHLRLNLKDKE